jgi:hypothetical protein
VALDNLIVQLLTKEPGKRPASAREVADRLQAMADAGEMSTVSVPVQARPVRQLWPWLVGGTAVLAVLTLGVAVVLTNWPATSEVPHHPPPPNREPGQAGPGVQEKRYRGLVDVRIWRKDADGNPERLRLSEDEALPLQVNDQFRIEAEVEPPAYLYLFWVDSEGKTVPVYPWTPGKWGTRPMQEQPLAVLSLPPTATKGYTISGMEAGMETLLLLARPDRLPLTDEQIRVWFEDMPPQRPFQKKGSAVWFENGGVVQKEGRRPRDWEENQINDPVLQVQGLLQQRVGPHGVFNTAVSFARLGKK